MFMLSYGFFYLEKNEASVIVWPMNKVSLSLFIFFQTFAAIFFGVLTPPSFADSKTIQNVPEMVLENAVMCSSIENFRPLNPAVVFSISQGEVFCYSNFDPVNEKSFIFHKWYKKDKLIFTMRLTLSPPKWASFSSIKTRNADKGPWRVEIRTIDGTLLQILRFSVAD